MEIHPNSTWPIFYNFVGWSVHDSTPGLRRNSRWPPWQAFWYSILNLSNSTWINFLKLCRSSLENVFEASLIFEMAPRINIKFYWGDLEESLNGLYMVVYMCAETWYELFTQELLLFQIAIWSSQWPFWISTLIWNSNSTVPLVLKHGTNDQYMVLNKCRSLLY